MGKHKGMSLLGSQYTCRISTHNDIFLFSYSNTVISVRNRYRFVFINTKYQKVIIVSAKQESCSLSMKSIILRIPILAQSTYIYNPLLLLPCGARKCSEEMGWRERSESEWEIERTKRFFNQIRERKKWEKILIITLP